MLQKKFGEPAKGFLAKATPTTQQKTNGFCSSDSPKDWFFECDITFHKEYRNLMTQKKEMGNATCWNLNVKFNSLRWAAKLKRLQG